ncbi:MAG: GAF domain-containing protein [Elusimicrobiota bacterium]
MKLKSYWYEIPVLFLLALVFQRQFFPDIPSFFQVSPHPFWIGVLVFGLRYGLTAGIAGGVCAAGLYLGGLWFSDERFRFDDADFYLLPGLFVVLGALIGGVVGMLEERNRDTKRELDEHRERVRQLVEELVTQRKTNRAIEQQVVSQMSSLVTLYQGARELDSLDRKDLLDGILSFFAEALRADKAALHVREKGQWVLYGQKGWADGDAYPKKLDMSQGVIGRAGVENRVVSLRDWFGQDVEQAWRGKDRADAIMAGPLRRDDGEVIGVFSVQDMPLLRFNSASVNLLTLLVDWAETAISKSLYFEELKSKTILDEVYNVYNETYFKSRSEQEFGRSKTYTLPFSMLLVAIEGLKDLPHERQLNLLRAVGRLLQEVSRDIDIVTKSADPGIPFAVMMMTASVNQARGLRTKILDAFGKLGFAGGSGKDAERALSIKIGIGTFAPAMKAVGEIIAEAREDLR